MITKEEMEIRLDYLSGYAPAIFCEILSDSDRKEKINMVMHCLKASTTEFDNIFFRFIRCGNYEKKDDLFFGYYCNRIILLHCLKQEIQLGMNRQKTELILKYNNLNTKKLEQISLFNRGKVIKLEKKQN